MGPLRRAGQSLLALALARAEFASIELSLAARAALGWVFAALAASVLAMLALIALSATLVAALWDHYSWYPLAALALLYCGATVLLLAWLARSVSAAPPLLRETFAELAKDAAAVQRAAATAPEEDGEPDG